MPDENQNPGGAPNGDQNPGGVVESQQPPPAQPPTDWRTGLPKELQSAPTWSKFKGKDWTEVGPQIATSYANLEKAYGGSVRIPGENAKPEEVAEFHRKLGVPDSPDKYDVKPAVPEGLPWDEGAQKSFQVHAHKIGLTPKQVTSLMNEWYIPFIQQGLDSVSKATSDSIEKGMAALTEKWGANRDRNIGLVQRTVQEYGGPELVALLEEPIKLANGTTIKLGDDPRWLSFAHRVGETSLEHGFIQGDALTVNTKSAQEEIAATLNDKDHPYWKKDDPKHAAALKRMKELYGIAYPD